MSIARGSVRAAIKLLAACFQNSIANVSAKSFHTSLVSRITDEPTSSIAKFCDVPKDPITMFLDLLNRVKDDPIIFNLATIDKKFGVLNRTMTFRCFEDSDIVYATTTVCQGAKNIKRKSKVSATFEFADVDKEMWQVRLFDAVAIELNGEQIEKKWCEEHLSSKIRHRITTCGKQVVPSLEKQKHDILLEQVLCQNKRIKQPKTYTVMRIEAKRWDFYKSLRNQIGARVQYRKNEDDNSWKMLHISA